MKNTLTLKLLTCLISLMSFTLYSNVGEPKVLTAKEKSMVTISTLTANGDLENLKTAITDGLEAGLTVNEIKEVIVHIYAYCGFPRSIRGLQTAIAVLDERKAQGIIDVMGKEASLIKDNRPKYDRGKENLEKLVNAKLNGPQKTYAQFSPEIEVFLKEHLFADIFERDVLNFRQRELATVAALIAVGKVEPMIRSHMNICLVQGITPNQLSHLVKITEQYIKKDKTSAAKQVLDQLLESLKLSIEDADENKRDKPKENKSEFIIRISEIEVHPESLNEYKAILKEEAAASVELEAGVISIFPMFEEEKPCHLRILEIYADLGAYESHLQTPHFKHYKTSTVKMVKSLQLVDMESLDVETMDEIFKKSKQ